MVDNSLPRQRFSPSPLAGEAAPKARVRARFPLSQRHHEHYASARRLSCPAKRGRGTILRSRTVEGASAAPLALDAPSTAQTRGPPPPLRFTTRGRISERIPATRSAPGVCEKCTVGSLPTGPARSGRPDDKLHSVTHHAERWVSLRSTHPTKRNDDKEKRKRNADRRVQPTSAPPPSSSPACGGGHRRGRGACPCLFPLPRLRGRVREGARSPIGVPPRLLLQRANAAAQLQIRTSWDLVGRSDPKASNNRVRKTVRFFSA